jgi:hypothetical protein
MSVLYTSTYSIAPSVDLTEATAESINSIIATSAGPDYATNRDQKLQAEIDSGVTILENFCVVLDRTNRKFITQRQYTTTEAAQSRKDWIIANVADNFADYTRDSIVLAEGTEISQQGFITI